MLVVGLTGGIGCGKSVVASRFANLNVPIVDTDDIAHKLTEVGGAALPAIKAVFGDHVLQIDGALNRPLMRGRIFSDALERRKLETILHPLILQNVQQQLRLLAAAPYVLIVVPLLLETQAYRKWVNRILVVDCLESQQIERVQTRNNMDVAEIKSIMATQCSRPERLEQADDVLINTGDFDFLSNQIDHLHHKYLKISVKQL